MDIFNIIQQRKGVVLAIRIANPEDSPCLTGFVVPGSAMKRAFRVSHFAPGAVLPSMKGAGQFVIFDFSVTKPHLSMNTGIVDGAYSVAMPKQNNVPVRNLNLDGVIL